MPSSLGKGVLIVPQVHGETLIGPTSEDVVDNDNRVTASGLGHIVTEAVKISKYIQFYDNIRNFAGVRAKSSYDDFYIKESIKHAGFYHLSGIDSPGLTAAPAIAKYLVEMINAKTPMQKKITILRAVTIRLYLDILVKKINSRPLKLILNMDILFVSVKTLQKQM